VWMTEATSLSAVAAAAALVRWCGAEGMGRAGPWNKSIPNGRETDGREKGGLAAECHSAPADIVLRAYMFFFVFNSNSRFILFYIIAPPRFLLALWSAGLDANPLRAFYCTLRTTTVV